MRRININYVQPGMELARNIYHSDGRILLRESVVLTDVFIYKLKEEGIFSLYINDDLSSSVDLVDIISEEARQQSIESIKQAYTSLERKSKINTQQVRAAIDRILEDILKNKDVLLNISDISAIDDYTMVHSVNVCIMSIMIGVNMMLGEKELRDLGIGAMLHDIGKASTDQYVVKKAVNLTPDEREEFQRHTEAGFEILRKYPGISLLSAHVAYQHHEFWDGTGYPRGMVGDKILNYARIVAVADTYDRLLDERYTQIPITTEQAIQVIRNRAGVHFDADIVSMLMSNIAVYPVGSIVELNQRFIAIVAKQNKDKPGSPIVRLIFDMDNESKLDETEIDLSTKKTIRITKTLKDWEIQDIFYQRQQQKE